MKRREEKKGKGKNSDSTMFGRPPPGEAWLKCLGARLKVSVTDWRTSADRAETRLAIGGTAL
jgi:hypothetical protein